MLLVVSLAACNNEMVSAVNFYVDDELYCSAPIFDGEFTVPTPPKKEGYTFDGWYLDKQFQEALVLTNVLEEKITAGANLYAKFLLGEVVSCNITLQPNNGDTPILFNLTADNFKFPVITKQGYSFDGWYSNSDLTIEWTSFDTLKDGDVLSAKWRYVLPTVLINFQTNGGSEIISMYADAGSRITQPTCVREGYNLIGWFSNAECTAQWDFDSNTATVGITLYAKWSEKFTVTIYGRNNKVLESYQVARGESIRTLPTVTEDGNFIFSGWFEDVYGFVAIDITKPITANMNIWSKWKEKKEEVSVTYVVDGQQLATIQNEKNTTIAPYNAIVKDGLSFFGWYSDAAMTKLWDFKAQLVRANATLYGQYMQPTDCLIMSLAADDTYIVVGVVNSGSVDDIVIPEYFNGKMVTAIGDQAFTSTSAKRLFVSRNIKTIGGKAFDNACKLVSMYIPSTVEHIEMTAFASLNSLTIINLDTLNSNYIVHEDAIYSSDYRQLLVYAAKSNRQLVKLPAATLYIADFAFAQADNLKRVYLNERLHSIGNSAFFGCNILETLVFQGNVKSIGARAFKDCVSLKQLTLPISVGKIGAEAFADCNKLVQLTLPQFCDNIGEMAFKGLTALIRLDITCAIGAVESNAFANCGAVIYVNSPSLPTNWANNWAERDSIVYAEAYTSQDSLWQYTLNGKSATITAYLGKEATVVVPTMIDGYTVKEMGAIFVWNHIVNRVVIQAELQEIVAGTFEGASKLGSIVLPSTLQAIGANAFNKCVSLASLSLSASINEIGEGAFQNCSSLQRVDFPAVLTNIPTNAFYNCTMLANIKLNDSLKYIGEGAFYNCVSLSIITWNNQLLAVGDSAFYNCLRLRITTLPNSLTSVGDNAFNGCAALTVIALPQNVKSVGVGAFQGCISLSKVIFAQDSALEIISSRAFMGCEALTVLDFPSKLITIDDYAFAGASSLRNVTFGTALSKIGAYTFKDCNIVGLNLPSSLLYLGDFAFKNCVAMQFAVVNADIARFGAGVFDGISGMAVFVDGVLVNYWESDWACGNSAILDGRWSYVDGLPVAKP